ncbi:AMP-binding protein [Pseudoduganella namucuonensis]|uniref:AMP-binding protein n=1 Tax=Pseudoduganella namucuonensis TaxID=1035707 RepID=UPI001160B7A0|nr:AMP-binding protein [Pseudoduganella namucuonensis]
MATPNNIPEGIKLAGATLYRIPVDGMSHAFVDTIRNGPAGDEYPPEDIGGETGAAGDDPGSALQRRFEMLAQTNPGALAVRGPWSQLTYGELDAQADGLAMMLQQHGAGPGRVCALNLAPSIALVRVVLAVLKSGAASLLLDPGQSPERRHATLRERGATLLLTGQPRDLELGVRGSVLFCPEDDAALPYGWPLEHPTRRLSPAYVEAGAPRPRSHGAVLDGLLAAQRLCALRQGDAVLMHVAAPPYAVPWDVLWPLSCGARLVIPTQRESSDGYGLGQLLRRERVAVMPVTPSLCALLERDPPHPGLDSMRALLLRRAAPADPAGPLHRTRKGNAQ